MRILQIVNGLRDASFQLAQGQRAQRFSRFFITINVAQRIEIIGGLTQLERSLIHLFLQRRGFRLHVVDFIQQLQSLREVLLNQFFLRRQVFLVIQRR